MCDHCDRKDKAEASEKLWRDGYEQEWAREKEVTARLAVVEGALAEERAVNKTMLASCASHGNAREKAEAHVEKLEGLLSFERWDTENGLAPARNRPDLRMGASLAFLWLRRRAGLDKEPPKPHVVPTAPPLCGKCQTRHHDCDPCAESYAPPPEPPKPDAPRVSRCQRCGNVQQLAATECPYFDGVRVCRGTLIPGRFVPDPPPESRP